MIRTQTMSHPHTDTAPPSHPVHRGRQPGRPEPLLVRLSHAPGQLWIVEGGDGLFGGAFRDQASALNFARDEASTISGARIVLTGPVEARRRA